MTQTKQPKQKFKVGDLVQYFLHKEYRPELGIGIIIATEQDLRRPPYLVYWTKVGFDWEYENRLGEVSK